MNPFHRSPAFKTAPEAERSFGTSRLLLSPSPMIMLRLLVLGAVAALAAPASAKDYAGTALNIIPSGQYGGLPINPQADVQAKMYDGLTPLFDKVTPTDLTTYFKSERFGADDSCPCTTEPTPRSGLTLVRDKFNVPHLTGKTRDDATWVASYEIHGPGTDEVVKRDLYGVDSMQALESALQIVPLELAVYERRGRVTLDGQAGLGFRVSPEPAPPVQE